MISESESSFLSAVLAEVPSQDPVSDIEFQDSEIQGFYSQADSGGVAGSGFNPKKFFRDSGYSVCVNCGAKVDRCGCGSTDGEKVYFLDIEYIVEQWCEHVESIQLYEALYVEEDGPPIWRVEAVSREFGVVAFFVVSEGDRLIDVEGDVFEKNFVVSLIESEEVVKQDYFYMWYELLDRESHATLHSLIRDTVEPLSDGVCDRDSEVTQNNINAIDNNLRKYIESAGFSRVDAQREVGGVGRELDFSAIDFAAKSEDEGEEGVILICGCEKSAKDVHLHYVVRDEVQPVSDCETAVKAASRMRERVDRLETLRQKTHNLGSRARALVVVAGAVSVGPIVSAALGGFDLAADDFSGYPFYPRIVFSVILLAFFVALILPMVRMSFFSWDIRNQRSRVKNQLPFFGS